MFADGKDDLRVRGGRRCHPPHPTASRPRPMSRLVHSIRPLQHALRAQSTRAMSNAALRKAPAALADLAALTSAGWSVVVPPSAPDEQRLQRNFKFKDFSQAWAFMSRVALAAEKLNVRRSSRGLGGRGRGADDHTDSVASPRVVECLQQGLDRAHDARPRQHVDRPRRQARYPDLKVCGGRRGCRSQR